MQTTRKEFTDEKLGMTLVVQTKSQDITSGDGTGIGNENTPALALSVDIYATGDEARSALAKAAKLDPDVASDYVTEGGDINLLHLNPLDRECGRLPGFEIIKKALVSSGIEFNGDLLAQARAAYGELLNQPHVDMDGRRSASISK